MIRTIGLAIAFSPTAERMLAEAAQLAKQFRARLVLIHVGEHGQKQEEMMQNLLASRGLTSDSVIIQWHSGNAARAILNACDHEKIDLLVAGALKKENIIQYYLGTVARHIMRQAKCSVLLLTQPSLNAEGFRNIVVDAQDTPEVENSISQACQFGKKDNASWVHVVRELKMYGLAMASSDQLSEDEYEKMRHSLIRDEIEKVEKLIQRIPHAGLKMNIKIVSGKSGFELAQFATRKEADLLVVSAPPRRFKLLDRVFTHDLEYVFADLPCSLLIVNKRREDRDA